MLCYNFGNDDFVKFNEVWKSCVVLILKKYYLYRDGKEGYCYLKVVIYIYSIWYLLRNFLVLFLYWKEKVNIINVMKF